MACADVMHHRSHEPKAACCDGHEWDVPRISDQTAAVIFLDNFQKARRLLPDNGYDANWFRDAPEVRRIKPYIRDNKPEKIHPVQTRKPDGDHVRQVKTDGRFPLRCGGYPALFFCAICFVAIVMFWPCVLRLMNDP
ncbi:hypothetical protein [Komagataeibacter saccharivorans]|uniref:hypothetical protein n=1 Tax=Komagataeibacter saccharivorans TaxID=265959 RepID=UPI001404F8B1|nr:hypothetical protein [Komagataeibacter saccharivorans]